MSQRLPVKCVIDLASLDDRRRYSLIRVRKDRNTTKVAVLSFCVGNFTLQFNLTFRNNTAGTIPANGVQLFVITANSGFFESIRGSSRIIKGVLSEQDIISAPLAPMGTRDMLHRMVGGAGMFSSLANVLSKAKDIYSATKPAVSAIKGMLPEGKVKDVLGAVGYGQSGGAESGGAQSGGRKGLRARIM